MNSEAAEGPDSSDGAPGGHVSVQVMVQDFTGDQRLASFRQQICYKLVSTSRLRLRGGPAGVGDIIQLACARFLASVMSQRRSC